MEFVGQKLADLHVARTPCVLGLVSALGFATGVLAQESPPPSPGAATPTIVVKPWSFNSVNGAAPMGGVMIDSAGNLVGTASGGGANGDGVVFMIAKTSTGFAKSPTVIASFNGTNGQTPTGGLIADAKGDLFGTTEYGGKANIYGSYFGVVFQITNSVSGYGKSAKVLADLGESAGEPIGSLAMDSTGNLFGTAYYAYRNSSSQEGAVFELKKSGSAYATAATPIVVFNGSNGGFPEAGLLIDSKGNLFGTTSFGGSYGDGTVFQVLKTTTGYRNAPTNLRNFSSIGSDGNSPMSGVVADAEGDVFGTTQYGGMYSEGIVYELVKIGAGYSFKTLVNFDITHGANPLSGVVIDAVGNLFGATSSGGTNYYYGTVFKIAKTATGYASTPTVLVNFNGANGQNPQGNLVADSNGNLFGTAKAGGTNGQGTVFEVSGSGFVVK